MKKIINWRKASICDFETNALLREVTKIHVLGFCMADGKSGVIGGSNHKRIKAFFDWHIKNEIPVVGHNFHTFDIPMVEKVLGIDLSELMVIDSLALSWQLNFDRDEHGLGTFHQDYGVEKPVVHESEWKGIRPDGTKMTDKEFSNLMHLRVTEDVKINTLLWQDFMQRFEEMYSIVKEKVDNGEVGGKRVSEDEVISIDLKVGQSVDEWVSQVITFLCHKAWIGRLQEETGFDVDVNLLNKNEAELSERLISAQDELKSVMPMVVKYKDKKKPEKPYKKNGELSVAGESWTKVVEDYNNQTKDEYGNLLVIQSPKEGHLKVIDKYEEPNPNSPAQVKSFLFSHGWVPRTFKAPKTKKFKREMNEWAATKPRRGAPQYEWEEWKSNRPQVREVPQITKDGDEGKELCESVEELAEDVPEIKVLADYSTVKHRLGVLQGFQNNLYQGRLQARIGGYTNTLRIKGREICNLPSTDKPLGKYVRDVLIPPKGLLLCGSDLASLEDRVRHHFMIPHDPEYVKTMSAPDYDSHITTALAAGLITKEEFDEFMSGVKKDHVVKARKIAKTVNYASVYSAGPATIAKSGGMSIEEATKAHKGYWELNWSVNAIAEEQVVIEHNGGKWLINPINGFCYSLRTEKDRFSTLIQGTGSYIFDLWVDLVLQEQKSSFNKQTLTMTEHDCMFLCIKDHPKAKQWVEETLTTKLKEVDKQLMLRREMGCGFEFGKNLSECH